MSIKINNAPLSTVRKPPAAPTRPPPPFAPPPISADTQTDVDRTQIENLRAWLARGNKLPTDEERIRVLRHENVRLAYILGEAYKLYEEVEKLLMLPSQARFDFAEAARRVAEHRLALEQAREQARQEREPKAKRRRRE